MPIFYYHPFNQLAKDLAEADDRKSFIYQSRGELEFKLQRLLGELGYDIWSSFYTVMGSLGASINYILPLNPDDPIDAQTIKICKNNAPWSFIKILNGPQLQGVVGYCSGSSVKPIALTNAEMAQKGISSATYVPRMMQ